MSETPVFDEVAAEAASATAAEPQSEAAVSESEVVPPAGDSEQE